MTLFQMLSGLALFIVALLASYLFVLRVKWFREYKARRQIGAYPVDAQRWEVGCRIRTARDPHAFLPGVWRTSAVFADGAKEWERIA